MLSPMRQSSSIQHGAVIRGLQIVFVHARNVLQTSAGNSPKQVKPGRFPRTSFATPIFETTSTTIRQSGEFSPEPMIGELSDFSSQQNSGAVLARVLGSHRFGLSYVNN